MLSNYYCIVRRPQTLKKKYLTLFLKLFSNVKIPFFRKTQAKIQSFMDAQKTFFILGSLCQWKAEIFKSFGGSPMDLKGHCDWLQLACEIYNFFWIDLSEFILKGNLERLTFRT